MRTTRAPRRLLCDPHGRRRRVVTLSAVGALSATALLPSASALGAAAPEGPLVTLAAAARTVTLSHYPDEPVFLFDLGIYAVTGGSDLEVRTTRPDYRTPLSSTLVLTTDGRRTTTRLPAGLADFNGLRGFATQTVKDAAGRTVSTTRQTWCPGGFGASRVVPDAAALTRYPDFCQGSPWGFGTVTGMPAHWASSVGGFDFMGFDPDNPPPTLPDGTYTVTSTISQKWRTVLRTPKAKASASVQVTVTTIPFSDDGGGGAGRATAAPAPRAAAAAQQFPTEVPARLLGRADGLLPRTSSMSGAGATSGAAGLRAPGAESVPSVPAAPGASALTAAGGAMDTATARRAVPKGHRPDLRSLPAFGIGVIGDVEDPLSTKEYLGFAATVWNAGPAPLVVDGYRTPGSDLMDAYQFFYDRKGKQAGWTGTGSLRYDSRSGHEHWHFLDFAKYELLSADGRTTILSQKEAFCLAPTDAVDLTARGARYQPNSTGLSTACGGQQSLALRETLDAGWGDTYGQFLAGQSFDISALPNGRYVIRVTANPDGNLVEGSTTNNVSDRVVVLGGAKGRRTVTVPAFDGLDIP
ncbi:MAG: lysyl oxidase family protein [Kineosporiaceae bacterium]